MESAASEIARQLGRDAEAVCRHYLSNGRKQGRYWIAGDVDNNAGRSLYVRLTGPASGPGAAGKWTDAANGSHGDLLDLIAANLYLATLGETLEEARRFLSLPRPDSSPKTQSAPVGSPEAARRLFAMGQLIAGTLAETYLRDRTIIGLGNPPALRFHPHCYYRRADPSPDAPTETWPALLAKVTDIDGTLTGVHRIWLDPATGLKAPVDPPRKALGRLHGHGVRIGTATTVIATGEGLETLLSLRMAFPDLPIVAALSAAHLAELILPPDLARLYIAVDADAAGRAASGRLAKRAEAQGIEAISLQPRHGDFNDDLRALGVADLRAHLRSQLAPEDIDRLLPSTDR